MLEVRPNLNEHGFLHTFANSSTIPAENIDRQKNFIQILATQILVEILILDVSAVMPHVSVLFLLTEVEPWYMMLGKQFVGMMPFMLIIAAVLSAVARDWTDFAVITLMLIVNAPCLNRAELQIDPALFCLPDFTAFTCVFFSSKAVFLMF